MSPRVTGSPALRAEGASRPNWIEHVEELVGCPDEEEGLEKPQLWGKIRFICSLRIVLIKGASGFVEQEMIFLCVGIFVYTSLGFIFKVNVHCDLFFYATSNFSLF